MQIAFNGGDVEADLSDNQLYLCASDLLLAADITRYTEKGVRSIPPYKEVDSRTDISYRTRLGSSKKGMPSKYVKLSDAFEFLDAVHVNTRPATMMLMGEIAMQFEKQLYPE